MTVRQSMLRDVESLEVSTCMAMRSHWKAVRLPRFASLRNDLDVDSVIVGGGLTGITAAYLLKTAGQQVALLERDCCAQLDTGNTTAHLTYVTDLRIQELIDTLGHDHAQAVWDAGMAALEQIEQIVATEKIACDFSRIPGHLHAALSNDREEITHLRRDADLANELGFPAEFIASVPVFHRPGVRFANQAKFHPLMYLAQLVTRIAGDGSHVFEQTEAESFERDGDKTHVCIAAKGRAIRCRYVIIATDVPLTGLSNVAGAALLQTKLAPYTSYAIGARLPSGRAPEALFWDTSDPYYYLRIDRQRTHDYAVFGGLDHKTGQVDDTSAIFEDLTKTLLRVLPEAKVVDRWSGQVIESHDGLPLIGETAPGQFIATGFSGNGLTFGTLAAMMACDAITGRKNPWRELFDPGRKQLKRGVWNYLRENLDYPYYMIKDRVANSQGTSLRSLKRGQGKILNLKGGRVAAFRDAKGKATILSPVCTHLGCIVHWNDTENTWDCPCHGSRFRATGELLAGPAETPLSTLDDH